MKVSQASGKALVMLRKVRFLLAAGLLLSLLASGPSAPVVDTRARVQPVLLEMAAQHPDSMSAVIVQKAVSDGSVERAIARAGGRITKDLHIINAVAAELPTAAAVRLAQTPGVRWISLDMPTQSATVDPVFITWATRPGSAVTSSNSDNFTSTPINAGTYLWFSAVLKVNGLTTNPTTISTDDSAVNFTANGNPFTIPLPAATVTYSPTALVATTTYDPVSGDWQTVVPSRLAGNNVFLTGAALQVPVNLPGSLNPVTWTGTFTSDTPGVTVSAWKWAAAAYTNLSTDYTALGIKPCDDSSASQYLNSDKAGTPENYKASLTRGAKGDGGTNYTGAYSSNKSVLPTTTLLGEDNMLSTSAGPDGLYAHGSNILASFGGFAAESSPGDSITTVEAVLKAYVPARLGSGDDTDLTIAVGGQAVRTVSLNNNAFDPFVSELNAGLIYIDLTGGRTWTWADFDNGIELRLDQSHWSSTHYVYYDAIGLRVTTTTGGDTSGGSGPTSQTSQLIDPNKLNNPYDRVVRASDVWNEAPGYYQGQGVTVAVLDSGVLPNKDLKGRILQRMNFNDEYHNSFDGYGHGTFVAGIIAGDGELSNGRYVGIAPRTNIVNVRVSDDIGASTESDVVSGMQWVLDHKTQYNIRVLNMSLNSSAAQSYHTSPMDAAAEILWFNGIVVVVSAGNNGNPNLFPPANDPFVITVGATDDHGTLSLSDDTVAAFSAYGTTETGAAKPEIVAPGRSIIGVLPRHGVLTMSRQHTSAQVNDNYFRMSGTSMSAPMVSGAVALLLQAWPNLNPDQVKYRLMSTALGSPSWPGYDPTRAGAGYLNIYAALHSNTTSTANTNTPASQLLWTGEGPVNWNSINWNSINWNSINWNSINWNSINWNSINWKRRLGSIDRRACRWVAAAAASGIVTGSHHRVWRSESGLEVERPLRRDRRPAIRACALCIGRSLSLSS